MTSSQEIALRYSTAYFSLVKSKKNLKEAFQEVENLKAVFDNHNIIHFFDSPIYTIDQKKDILNTLIDETKGSKILKNFLNELIENGRFSLVSDIFEKLKKLYNEDSDEIEVEVISASNLTEKQLNNIKQALSKKLKKTITLSTKVNPKILGGLIIRHESKMVDGSLKTQLDNIRLKLKEL